MAVSHSFLPGLTETSVSDVRAESTRGMDPLVRPFGNVTRRRASVNESKSRDSLETALYTGWLFYCEICGVASPCNKTY